MNDYFRKNNNENLFYTYEKIKEFKKNEDIASYIKNKLSTMEEEEIKKIHNKITYTENMYNDLLYFELKNYKPNENEKINDFIMMTKFISDTLKKFRPNIVNSYIEDNEWNIHLYQKSLKYDLLDNEVIFDNSINKIHIKNITTLKYLDDLHKYMNRFCGNKLKIELKIIQSIENICWITFRLHHI